jgi:hypothetical protein
MGRQAGKSPDAETAGSRSPPARARCAGLMKCDEKYASEEFFAIELTQAA